jgi:hypothetical protein
MDIDDNECKSCDALWELIMKLTAERDSLRQQLAEQTSSIELKPFGWLATDEKTGVKTFTDSPNEGYAFIALFTESQLTAKVEVLLEALRKIAPKRIGKTIGEDYRDMKLIANDALNAYSSKPQKHLDN